MHLRNINNILNVLLLCIDNFDALVIAVENYLYLLAAVSASSRQTPRNVHAIVAMGNALITITYAI